MQPYKLKLPGISIDSSSQAASSPNFMLGAEDMTKLICVFALS